MLKNYLKIAWRNIMKQKIFSLINIIGLTIGLSTSFIIGLMVYYDYTFDDFHKDGNRIYRVVTNFSSPEGKSYNSGVTLAMEDALTDNSNFETVSGFYIKSPESVENQEMNFKFRWPKQVIFTDEDYFDIIEYNFLAGSKELALKNPNNVVLTENRAAKYYPGLKPSEIIGKTLVYNNSLNVKITAIVESIGKRTDFVFEEFLSTPTVINTVLKDEYRDKNWNQTGSNFQLLVKLKEFSSFQTIQMEFDALAKKHQDDYSKQNGISRQFNLQPLKDIHFNKDYGVFDGAGPQASKILLNNLTLIAFFLLILGCINFINLNTAQASYRAREIGIRKTLGSSKRQLIAQFMGETFLLVLFSAIVSLVFSFWLIKIFSDFLPQNLGFKLLKEPIMFCGLIVLLFSVTFLSGFYPAMILSKFNTIAVLKNHLSVGEKKVKLRKVLTVFQFTMAQVFIIAALLVGMQIDYLLNKNMGFKTDSIVSVYTPKNERQLVKKKRYLQKLKAIPQIELVSLGGHPPASNSSFTTATKYYNEGIKVQTDLQFIFGDINYSKLFELEFLAGRSMRGDTIKEMVINETARKKFGFKTPEAAIGKIIDFGNFKVPIVGVMNDFHQRSLKSEIRPMALVGDWLQPGFSRFQNIHIAFHSVDLQNMKSVISQIETAYGEVYTETSDFRLDFLDDTIEKFYRNEQKVSMLLSWSTGLSILISCLGLLGLVIYTTNRRTKEIGVRKVLGASLTQLNILLCKEFLVLIMIAFVLASPIAWLGINQWLQDFTYRIDINLWVFLICGLSMVLFALITIATRTLKAARANPVDSLHTE